MNSFTKILTCVWIVRGEATIEKTIDRPRALFASVGREGCKMIKGAQKRVVVIRTSESRVFEEAYFVMRGNVNASGGDMVAEANRIIEENAPKKVGRRRVTLKSVLLSATCFFGGSAVGALAVIMATLPV